MKCEHCGFELKIKYRRCPVCGQFIGDFGYSYRLCQVLLFIGIFLVVFFDFGLFIDLMINLWGVIIIASMMYINSPVLMWTDIVSSFLYGVLIFRFVEVLNTDISDIALIGFLLLIAIVGTLREVCSKYERKHYNL